MFLTKEWLDYQFGITEPEWMATVRELTRLLGEDDRGQPIVQGRSP